MAAPINSVVISEQTFDSTTYTYIASIDEYGALCLVDEQKGARVEEAWNHPRYTKSRHIDAGHRDTVLLRLLKERFQTDQQLGTWLGEKGIPSSVEHDVGGD